MVGVRQASDPWTAAVSSFLALISRGYAYLAHHPCLFWLYMYEHTHFLGMQVYAVLIHTCTCVAVHVYSTWLTLGVLQLDRSVVAGTYAPEHLWEVEQARGGS